MTNAVVFLVTSLLGVVACRYSCLCNYHVELSVMATDLKSTIGYLYEFDCKQVFPVQTPDSGWIAVAFEHQVGYVEKDAQVQIQTCPGDPPIDDLIISTTEPSTEMTSTPFTTSSKATISLPKTGLPSTSIILTTPDRLTTLTSQTTTIKPSTETTSTTFPTSSKSTTAVPTTLVSSTTQSPTPSTLTTQERPWSSIFHITSQTTKIRPSTVTTSTTFPTSSKSTTSVPKISLSSTSQSLTPSTLTTQDRLISSTVTSSNPTSKVTPVYITNASEALTTFTTQKTTITSPPTTVLKTLSTSGATTTLPSTIILATSLSMGTTTTSLPTTPISSTMLTTQSTTPTPITTKLFTTEITSTLKETTTPEPKTSASTTIKTTTPTTTTIKSTLTTQPITEEMLCPRMDVRVSMDNNSIVTHNGKVCYEVINNRIPWIQAEINCRNHNGGHLLQISSAEQQKFIFDLLHTSFNHPIWIGLHDRNNEGQFQWGSGDASTYRNWNPNSRNHETNHEDCVLLVPNENGLWDDKVCAYRHYYICQYPTRIPNVSPTAIVVPQTDGNINMCPGNVRHHANTHGGILGQHAQWCYELLPHNKFTWQHSEDTCNQLGGHLVHISNAHEQAFVQNLVYVYLHDHAIWIGLNDRQTEGRFQWTTGEVVQFTNWAPGHTNMYSNTSAEDCGVLIPYKNGQWEDIPCGHHLDHGGESGEAHPFMCQYRIISIGGISLVG